MPAAADAFWQRWCSVVLRRVNASRFVYVDVGANWGNTLRLFQDIGCPINVPWEIYAFEASPMMWPYLDAQVAFLNGGSGGGNLTRPVPPMPIAGSTADTVRFYSRWFRCSSGSSTAARFACIKAHVTPRIRSLLTDSSKWAYLNDSQLVRARLAEALVPNVNLGRATSQPRYTLVPAAAAERDGWLDMEWGESSLLRGGGRVARCAGSTSGGGASSSCSGRYRVFAAGLASWLQLSFGGGSGGDSSSAKGKTLLVLKMDVEGAEFTLLPSFVGAVQPGLISAMAWECHELDAKSRFNSSCARLKHVAQRAGIELVVSERQSGYSGMDSASIRELTFSSI